MATIDTIVINGGPGDLVLDVCDGPGGAHVFLKRMDGGAVRIAKGEMAHLAVTLALAVSELEKRAARPVVRP